MDTHRDLLVDPLADEIPAGILREVAGPAQAATVPPGLGRPVATSRVWSSRPVRAFERNDLAAAYVEITPSSTGPPPYANESPPPATRPLRGSPPADRLAASHAPGSPPSRAPASRNRTRSSRRAPARAAARRPGLRSPTSRARRRLASVGSSWEVGSSSSRSFGRSASTDARQTRCSSPPESSSRRRRDARADWSSASSGAARSRQAESRCSRARTRPPARRA